MTEDEFIDEQQLLIESQELPIHKNEIKYPETVIATDVYWVQCKYSNDCDKFSNTIKSLDATYILGLVGSQDFIIPPDQRMPYSFLNEQQYFMFKLSGIEHNVHFFSRLTEDRKYHALLIYQGVY